ncbi:MAG: replicative DNA helicase [Kiritimatiellae bacterium]|nr:replicative DNA helicase [Kiritimatiellia bacterium]
MHASTRRGRPVPAAEAVGVPPHSEAAEVGLLGSILVDGERVLGACASRRVKPDCFYNPLHREVFETALTLHDEGRPVDLLTVSARLRDLGRLEAIGGDTFLQGLVDATPTSAHADYYIEVLLQKRILRELLARAREVESLCVASGDADATDVLNRAEQLIFGIRDLSVGTAPEWPRVVEKVSEEIGGLLQARGARRTGLSTGFRNLDKILLGLQPSEMIVLAARPSVGKTSLAMNIVENVATGYNPHTGYPPTGRVPRAVAVFTLEMSAEGIVRRLICSRARVSWRRIVEGVCDATEQRRLASIAKEVGALSIFIDETSGMDVNELRARARRLAALHGIALIVVDYLQLLRCPEPLPTSRQEQIAQVSAGLKAMAKELRVPVLVLSQLNREPERSDRSGVPKMADLRDSGSIEQDADVILLMRRPIQYRRDPRHQDAQANPGLTVVDVAKQRNGMTGEVDLYFDRDHTLFSDMKPEGAGEADVPIRPSEGSAEE